MLPFLANKDEYNNEELLRRNFHQAVCVPYRRTKKQVMQISKGEGKVHWPNMPLSDAVVPDRAGVQPRPHPKPVVTNYDL